MEIDHLKLAPIKTHSAPVTEDYVLEIEEMKGAALPQGYREFLKCMGTSGPTEYVLSCAVTEKWEADVDVFLGHDPEKVYDIIRTASSFEGYLDPGFLPIAFDSMANVFCLGVLGDKIGRVYYWAKDEDTEPYLVAGTFDEFIKALRCEPYE